MKGAFPSCPIRWRDVEQAASGRNGWRQRLHSRTPHKGQDDRPRATSEAIFCHPGGNSAPVRNHQAASLGIITIGVEVSPGRRLPVFLLTHAMGAGTAGQTGSVTAVDGLPTLLAGHWGVVRRPSGPHCSERAGFYSKGTDLGDPICGNTSEFTTVGGHSPSKYVRT
jgi:hypothetical protein